MGREWWHGGADDDQPSPDGPDPHDEFDTVELGEDFVSAAPIREPTAAERERAAREARLRRLLADESARRENAEHNVRRYAVGDDDPFDDPVDDPSSPRRRRTGLRVVAVILVAAVVAMYVVSGYLGGSRSAASTSPTDRLEDAADAAAISTGSAGATSGTIDPRVRPEEWPPPREITRASPIGTPYPPPEGGGAHTFLSTQDDGVTPVGYDPCRAIHFVTRPGGPPAAEQLVREAIATVSLATGLRFVHDGTTDEAPDPNRRVYQPERYGERWAPVLIAWSDPIESPRLGEASPESPSIDVAGYAASQSVGERPRPSEVADRPPGSRNWYRYVYVTGSVVLDAPDIERMLDEPDGYARARAIVAHEIAHLVGLGHVDDPDLLMYPTARPTVTSFGPGDIEGLNRLGELDCFPRI